MTRTGYACVLGLGLLSAAAVAGPTTRPAGGPDVLGRVPADCLGFAVVKDIKDCTGKLDAFLQRLGEPGQEAPDSLAEITGKVKLGAGFDASGGFAAVMLDPQQYGVDLVTMIAGPADASEKEPDASQMPLVLLIPGTDPARMFAGREPVTEGGVVKFAGEDGTPRYCLQVGRHVALSGNLKAARAVAAGGTSVWPKLSARDKAFVAANDVSVWVNMKLLSPILDAAIARAKARAAKAGDDAEAGEAADLLERFGPAMDEWRDRFKQMADATLGARIAADGLTIEARATYRPDSATGKALATGEGPSGPLLGRLPARAYAAAFGISNPPRMPREWHARQVERMLARAPMRDLPAKEKARMRAAMMALHEQLRGVQLWVGPAGEGEGALRVACVLECLSAEKLRAVIADAVEGVVQTMKLHKAAGAEKLTLAYRPAAETLAGRKVDLIRIAAAGKDAREGLKRIVGSDRPAVMIVEADAKTLVMTLGGGKDFLAAALKAAGGGTLHANPSVAKALAGLHKRPMAVGVVNAKNVQAIIKAVRAAAGEKPVPVEITSEAPFAGAVFVEGTDACLRMHLPADTVKEVVQVVVALMMQKMMEAMQGAPAGE